MRLFNKQKTVATAGLDRVPKGYRSARSAEDLASQVFITTTIQQIRSLVSLPPQYFSLFYDQPLKKFLLLTQSSDNEVINDRLQAVVNGLKLRRAYILPKGVYPDSIREKKDRWTYAVFAALLMYDVARIVKPMNYCRTDSQCNKIDTWSPMANDVLAIPYAFKPIEGVFFHRTATPLLLHHLFDEYCLTWLSEDNGTFNNAIESMVEPQSTSSIGPLVIKIFGLDNKEFTGDNHPSNKLDTEPSIVLSDCSTKSAVPDTLPPIQSSTAGCSLQTNKPSARTMGRLFMHWLMTTLNDKDQSLQNQGLIHRMPQGLALSSPAVFQHYSAIAGYEWKQVQNGFLKLRLHQPNDDTHEPLHTLNLPDGSKISAIVIPS